MLCGKSVSWEQMHDEIVLCLAVFWKPEVMVMSSQRTQTVPTASCGSGEPAITNGDAPRISHLLSMSASNMHKI